MPEVFVELKAIITEFTAKMAEARAEMARTASHGGSTFSGLSGLSKAALGGVAAAAVGVGVESVKMAANFQQSMTKLVTSGGESSRNLKSDMSGVLKLMGETGTSSEQLAEGLYVINSAGFHGAAGLQVLKAAAQGAKTENADLGTVTDGLTTLMNDYHESASQAALVTSKMVTATSLGKTTFQDLAGSLHTVAPAADAAGLSMNEVLGAMATMTAKGTPAADAATYLRQTILQLENPSQKAASEMKALGLSSIDVSKNLGDRGLTGTLTMLTDAIQRKMGPAGIVLLEQLKKSASSTTNFQKVLANLPPVQQTYVAALANMVGGTKSMQAALELTGATMPIFQANVKKVAQTTTEAGNNVAGWKIVQGEFNQKMAEATQKAEALGIKLGLVLIPWVEKMVGWMSTAVTWFQKHKAAAEALAGVITGVLAAAITVFTVNKIASLVNSIRGAIGWFQKLGSTAKVEGAEVEASSSGMSGKFTGALGVMAAGVASFQVTTALLKSNFLGIGSAVTSVAKSISDFFGGVGQVKPSTSLTAQTVAFLEAIASGKQQASNISPAQAVADLHQQGVPGFATGGVVPGTRGAPMLAVVHGGETISPAGGGGGGDLVIRINGQEFARVAGPDLRNWLITQPGRSSTRIL